MLRTNKSKPFKITQVDKMDTRFAKKWVPWKSWARHGLKNIKLDVMVSGKGNDIWPSSRRKIFFFCGLKLWKLVIEL